MSDFNLKRYVQRSVHEEWDTFQQAHPHLAKVCDQDLMADVVTENIEDDPDYQETMADAQAMGTVATVMGDWVGRFVRRWMKQIGI